MSSQKHHEYMRNLDKCYNAVLQSSTKGITAIEISKKLGMHKTMVHRNLKTLELLKRVESQHGVWHVRPDKQSPNLEKEIVIELPIPKNEWQRVVLLEEAAKTFGGTDPDNIFRTSLEKLEETRTIRIKGKNVDTLDLERIGNLIREVNHSFSFNLKSLVKKLRVPKRQAPKSSET
jgi:predicted ArsR family transcriptional regulator